jgi:recombination protein RecA
MSNLIKKFGNTLFDKPRIFVSTGNLALDYIISLKYDGTGGVPLGWIVELAGKSQTGKTLLAAKMCSEFQKKGGYVFYADVERGYEFGNMATLGVDHTPIKDGGTFYYDAYDSIEDFYEDSTEFFTSVHEEHPGAPVIGVLDSLGFIKTEEELEKGIGYEDMGRRAKKNKEMMRLLLPILSKCNATLVVVNHVYATMSAVGPKLQTGGGMTFDYGPHLRVMFLATQKWPNDKDPEGVTLKAKIIKNRFNYKAMGKVCEFQVHYDQGPLKYSGLLSVLVENVEGLSQAGGWYDYRGHKFRSTDFAANPEKYFEMFKDGGEDATHEYVGGDTT